MAEDEALFLGSALRFMEDAEEAISVAVKEEWCFDHFILATDPHRPIRIIED